MFYIARLFRYFYLDHCLFIAFIFIFFSICRTSWGLGAKEKKGSKEELLLWDNLRTDWQTDQTGTGGREEWVSTETPSKPSEPHQTRGTKHGTLRETNGHLTPLILLSSPLLTFYLALLWIFRKWNCLEWQRGRTRPSRPERGPIEGKWRWTGKGARKQATFVTSHLDPLPPTTTKVYFY